MASRERPQSCCTVRAVEPLPASRLKRYTGLARALGDPNRLEIARFIARQHGPVCACDVVSRFDLSQPTVSHHLKVLRDAGVLRSRRKGLWSFYEPHAHLGDTLKQFAALLA